MIKWLQVTKVPIIMKRTVYKYKEFFRHCNNSKIQLGIRNAKLHISVKIAVNKYCK